MDTLIIVGIVWLLGGIVWSRVYFGRRHGVKFQSGLYGVFIPGQLAAVVVGMAWPVTIFSHWNPEWCSHPEHVLARDQIRAEIEETEARVQGVLRKERGNQ